MKTNPLRIFYFLFSFCIFLHACKNKPDGQAGSELNTRDTSELGKEIEKLSLEIIKDSTNADMLHSRAQLYIKKKEFQLSMADVNRAISIDSSKKYFYLTQADLFFAANKMFNAKSALEKCIALDDTNYEAHSKLAEIFFIVKKYNDALIHTSVILKSRPRDHKTFFIQGMVYKETGDTAKAINNFQTAIEYNQQYYDAYMQLGVLYQARNSPVCLDYFTGALKIKPQSEEAFYGRALYLQDHNELDKAIQDYTSITQINANNKNAHFNLGYIHYTYLKVYDQAIKHYSDAITADANYAEAYYNRGLCYEAVGNISAAKTDYEKALALRPGYDLALKGMERIKS